MTVSFQLPSEMEQSLRHDVPNLDGEAKEAFLVSLYRRGRISHVVLADLLGLDRFETEDVLRMHHVTEDLGTLEEYLADAQSLQKMREGRLR